MKFIISLNFPDVRLKRQVVSTTYYILEASIPDHAYLLNP